MKGRKKIIGNQIGEYLTGNKIVLGIRMCMVDDSLAGLSMAWSLLSHLALEKQPSFVH